MLKKARFAKPLGHIVEIEKTEKPGSGKSRGGSGGRDSSPPKSAGSRGSKKSNSPGRKGKSPSPGRKGSGDLKSAMRKGSGKDKGKRKTVVKSPDLTEDGLKIIDMSGQGMTVLPLSVLGAKDVGELCLASNNLRSLPVEIKRLTTLTKLDISKNGIRCTNPGDFTGIPAEITALENLHELKIAECNLPYVPPAIWQMTQLRILDISRNKISSLSADVGNLTSLVRLNLQQTNISTLPPEIAYCQELEEILLWGNTIESLPETLPEMLKLRTLAVNYRNFCAQVESFHESEELLRKGKLTSEHIPAVVFELSTLEVLDLENTKINNIPEMSTFSLRELYVCKNFLSKVPPSFFNLHHLTILDMSENFLTFVPDDISRMTSLVILRLSHNQVERIPNKIKMLHNLEELNVAENKIHYLPSAIGSLKKLKALFVEKNQLTSLPDEICELENLETLDITENRISALPMKMHQLKNLAAAHSFQRLSKYGLWLYKNPIVQPPPEIWKTERPEKIFEYLKKLAIIKTENLQRQKMLVFGQTGSGKTSLINGLIHKKSEMTKGEADKTRVLKQTPWRTDNNVEFMVHDFGGEDMYKIIYPMFVDSLSLAVIVYDHSTYITENHHSAIGQWLDFFNMYIPGVVVKLIGTHLDNFEEFAVKTDDELDENGNLSHRSRQSRSGSSRSSRSGRHSTRSLTSAQSNRSSISRKSEATQTDNAPGDTSTPDPESQANASVSPAKITEDLVKQNVQRQVQAHADKLTSELAEMENKIKQANAEGNSPHYLKHLQIQKKKLEFLIENQVRVMPDIALVSNNEGLYGVNAMIESLELMIIDKTLFPHAQRSVPERWNACRICLKQHKNYYLSWDTVEECGKKHGIENDELEECLQYLHNTGEILWFRNVPNLSKLVFQRPRILVYLLSALIRHDIESFLSFECNKVFMSKGLFSNEDFSTAKELFLRNGQISRPLMNCFWFYEELSYDRFNELLDLVPLLEICYSIPEPIIPNGKLYSYPIMVLPWYNQDNAGEDLTEHWSRFAAGVQNSITSCMTYSLPLGLPDGLFEKLVCQMQAHALQRVDWKNTILATTENGAFKIAFRKDSNEGDNSGLDVTVTPAQAYVDVTVVNRKGDTEGNHALLKELTREITELFQRTAGLLWTVEAQDALWRSKSIWYSEKAVLFEDGLTESTN